MVFTAGTRNYADPILDYLDPTHELIQHRLYRDSCTEVDYEGSKLYIKDLRIFENRKLEDIVIVDNTVISFAYQIDNGIPILPFKEDKDDTMLLQLIQILEDISKTDDWRGFIRRNFGLSDIMSTDTDSYAHLYEYSDSDEDSIDEGLDVLLKCQRSMSMSMKKIPEKKVKSKGKKKNRVSLKNIKKVKSAWVNSNGGMAWAVANAQIKSEKWIFPAENFNFFERNEAFKGDNESECVHLEEAWV
jgi:hypothetical protein